MPVCTGGPPRLLLRIAPHLLAWRESLCLWTHKLGDFFGAWGGVQVGLPILCCVVVLGANRVVHVGVGC